MCNASVQKQPFHKCMSQTQAELFLLSFLQAIRNCVCCMKTCRMSKKLMRNSVHGIAQVCFSTSYIWRVTQIHTRNQHKKDNILKLWLISYFNSWKCGKQHNLLKFENQQSSFACNFLQETRKTFCDIQ